SQGCPSPTSSLNAAPRPRPRLSARAWWGTWPTATESSRTASRWSSTGTPTRSTLREERLGLLHGHRLHGAVDDLLQAPVELGLEGGVVEGGGSLSVVLEAPEQLLGELGAV